MRPGAWSESGFLGPDEKLEGVLARDRQTLLRLGVTQEELADDLALLIDAPELVPPRGPHKHELREIQQRRIENQPSHRDHLTARF